MFNSASPKYIRIVSSNLKNRDIIFINSLVSNCYKPDVLAHELGHYQLHRKKLNNIAYHYRANYHKSIEEEAERYGRRLISIIRTLRFPPPKIQPEKSINTKEGWKALANKRKLANI